MKIKVHLGSPNAKLPKRSSEDAACFDLYATNTEIVVLQPHSGAVFGTGLFFEVPSGYALMIYSRSGHGFKNGVRLANCVGVIDADYRGEIKIKLAADNSPYLVQPGERIAQAMLIPVPQVEFEQVNHISVDTTRGAGGFGSTGAT